MKILLLNRSYYPHIGGIENSLYYLSREYSRMGHDVTILTEHIPGEYAEREEFSDIIRFPRKSFSKLLLPMIPWLNERRISSWIEENRGRLIADMVICRDPMLGLAYLKVFPEARVTYIPAVVIKYYNKGIRKSSSFTGLIKEVLRFAQLKIEEKQQKKILNLSEKNVVFSKNVKNQLLRGKLCPEEKITVCHPGVADKFAPKKSEYEYSKEEPYVDFVFVGRLVAEKNLSMLLEAFARLKCENKRLTLVGDGDMREGLEEQVRSLSLRENVIFAGATSEPELYYAKADFFVIPSSYESFGQVIIEALSMGLPVIGFTTIEGKTLTAIDELIQDGVRGFVCGAFNARALSVCLEKAAESFCDREKYLLLRNNAIEFANTNCSWENLAKNALNDP